MIAKANGIKDRAAPTRACQRRAIPAGEALTQPNH